ncbi:hypothetical protein QBC40DRAFT_292699 [Triangularia verruculosa]|uniref:Uncharacterized protein n=1 Tax=Triangularia verruculosa TaxID=2587418 RepID=A0AAN6XPE9_9PEZI|nr:hypothetical protein QBC40DRAFT_292699 [Triangularia verruculosa]
MEAYLATIKEQFDLMNVNNGLGHDEAIAALNAAALSVSRQANDVDQVTIDIQAGRGVSVDEVDTMPLNIVLERLCGTVVATDKVTDILHCLNSHARYHHDSLKSVATEIEAETEELRKEQRRYVAMRELMIAFNGLFIALHNLTVVALGGA